MNRSMYRIAMILICCSLLAGPIFAGDSGLTVGDFLYRIALARQLPAVDGPDAERLLRDSGADLPALLLPQRLTEGAVVAISGSLGIRVSTSRPDAPFDNGSVGAFLDLMAEQAEIPEGSNTAGEPGPYPRPNDQAADPRTKGRGKKKGLPPVSESSPV